MSRQKIDRVKMSRLLREGKSQKDIAKTLNVSEAAISKAKKELNINVVKNMALESAHRVVDKNLNAVEQLYDINQDAREILDLLMRWNRGEDEAIQVLESQVRKVRVGKTEKLIENFKFKDPRDLALKAMTVIESQLRLQLDIFKSLYDLREIAEFQRTVVEIIGQESPETRRRIVAALKREQALRGSVTIKQ